MSENKVESQVDNSTVATEAPVENAAAENAAPEANRPEKTESPQLKDLLSEDLREIKALQNYESVDAMAKSLLSAQEMVGKRVTDLSAEELATVNAKFNIPDSIEGYDFEAAEEFKKEALEVGLSIDQAKKLHEKQVSIQEATQKEIEIELKSKQEEAINALEKEFGSQFEARMDLARKTALELGGEDLEKGVFDIEEGIDPKIIKALSEAGKRIFDHESIQAGSAPKMTLEEVNVEINKLLSKENREILGNPTHGSHKAIKDKLMGLSELRNNLKQK